MPEKPAYSRSVFNQFFASEDPEVQAWRDNVLDKLYKSGIVPEYIVRDGATVADVVDEDYVAFWKSVATYFAWIVVYARKFGNIYDTDTLLLDYIREKGIAVRPRSTTSELQYVVANLYDEYRRRGTIYVFDKAKDYEEATGSVPTADMEEIFDFADGSSNVDGEFLRAIAKVYFHELMWNTSSMTNFGWTVDRCSPLYRGTCADYQLIKGYFKGEDADLSNVPVINSPETTVVTDVSLGKEVIELTGDVSGIGWVSGDPERKIVIDRSLNYEITFQLLVEDSAQIKFGVDFFDQYGNHFASNYIDGTASSELFFTGTLCKNSTYMQVRGICFSINEPIRSAADSMLDIGFGKHIQIPINAVYMSPKVLLNNLLLDPLKSARIFDFKVRLCDTAYERGFIQTPNVIQLWARNNNGSWEERITELNSVMHPITADKVITIPLLEKFVREYLIPYNSTVIFNWLRDPSTTDSYDDSYDNSHE